MTTSGKPLPSECFVSQDGGYFYFMADRHSDECLHYVDSGFDPEFGDFENAMLAREWLVANFPNVSFIFV
jgi:hypothetical protein